MMNEPTSFRLESHYALQNLSIKQRWRLNFDFSQLIYIVYLELFYISGTITLRNKMFSLKNMRFVVLCFTPGFSKQTKGRGKVVSLTQKERVQHNHSCEIVVPN